MCSGHGGEAMKQIAVSDFFGGYCYGPADLLGIELGDGYVRLLLRNLNGQSFSADYKGCVYWPITQDVVGKHFSVVQMIKTEKLSLPEYVNVQRSIKVSRDTAMESLDKWEAKGYHIYLHSTSKRDEDYVVVAKELLVNH